MDITQLTARELAENINQGRVSAEEAARAYIARIERYGGKDKLNAVCELDAERAILAARAIDEKRAAGPKPLMGVPVLVKDNIDVMGLSTTAGSLALEGNIARKDAPVIHNLREAGAVILGKTNLTEFANYTAHNMPGGYSSRGGQVIHAYDKAKNPSGSSAGSAVAMSAGLCAAAVGTDTSFSVVGCATENGVTGFKPTHGALSAEGIVPIAHTLDSAGALTRDVQDAQLLCACMRPSPVIRPVRRRDPATLRVCVNMFNRHTVSDEQLCLYEREAEKWRRAGVSIEEVNHEYTPEQRVIMKFEFKHDLEEYLAQSSAKIKTLKGIVEYYDAHRRTMLKYDCALLREALADASGKLNDAAYLHALDVRDEMRARLIPEFSKYDACVMTGPTNIMHFIGIPSIAIKLGLGNDGTPRGMILYGADEARLLEAALFMESLTPPTAPPGEYSERV